MKKVLSLVFAIVLVFGVFTVNAGAAEVTKAERFESAISRLYFYQYFMGEPFDENGSAHADVAYGFVTSVDILRFEDYAEKDEEKFTSHKIPQIVFERAVEERFVLTDTLLEGLRRRYLEGEYYYIYMGGFGDQMPTYYYVGSVDEGNGVYTAYGYLGENWDEETGTYDTYVPKAGEVEGVDYARKQYVYTDNKGNTQVTTYCVKITTAIKCKIEFNEIVKFLSYLEVPVTEIPAESTLTEKLAVEEKQTSVTVDPSAFAPGTVLKYNKVTEGELFDKVTNAVPKNTAFVLMDITASDTEGKTVQPNGKVKVTFNLPEGYTDADVYYVPESGAPEKLESTVDAKNGTITVELEHFSCYAVVKATPAGNETDTSVGETSEPANNESDDVVDESVGETSAPVTDESNVSTDESMAESSAPATDVSENNSQASGEDNEKGFNVLWVIIPVAIIAVTAVVIVIKKKK